MAFLNSTDRSFIPRRSYCVAPSNNHGAHSVRQAEPGIADIGALDSSSIQLCNWNIQKGKRPGWQHDLARMAHDRDLILIQEASMHRELIDAVRKANYWSFAPGYQNRKLQTGVMTMSCQRPMMHASLVTWEPWLGTPKATNVTEFSMTGTDETLMVVNIHAVNFTLGVNLFVQQIQQVHDVLEGHQGPVIFSGDFNTWRRERFQILDTMLSGLGLASLSFKKDKRKKMFGQHLDHIYTRQLQVVEASTKSVRSSDHNPMLVTLSL
jgi:endonuclease/exonuclease/phosphatase (EEP) superfamily protein YafD